MKVSETKQTPREITLYLLSRVEQRGAFVDRILDTALVRKLEQRDRLFIRELLLGVMRQKLRLDRIIETYYAKDINNLEPEILNILRLGLFQILFMNSVPDWAAVNESVRLASDSRGKGAAGLVNALLRRFLREGEPPLPENSIEKISIETSHPLWLAKKWAAFYGEETAESICRAGNEKHPVFIRTQTIRISPDELASRLAGEDFEVNADLVFPGYLMVPKGNGLFETDAFREGLFTVQDPSAGMASELLAPHTGESVVDLCAAPGGKSTHCAEIMNDCGSVVAVDRHVRRLGLVRETARRLGLTSITCIQSDARTYGNGGNIQYDRVLLDAPCSGTGVFSKRLDMRWHLCEEDIKRLVSVQRDLLNSAVHLVKPGGVLVYSTCSLEPEENEDNVAWFLDSHDDFTLENDARFIDFKGERGYIILPHRMNGIGAFASKLKRI